MGTERVEGLRGLATFYFLTWVLVTRMFPCNNLLNKIFVLGCFLYLYFILQ